MKFNQWTLGLAAVGAVSLVSAAKADEKMSVVQTAVSSTTISGYVSTSAHWNPGTGNGVVPGYAFNTPSKADGFNLDVVSITVAKALDETDWAAGYKFEGIYGPDANFFGTTPIGGLLGTDFAIKQAYVTVRTPIPSGNGIDWKLGVFDTIIGYESFDSGNNPNYTRSYGYTFEPTTHTGLLGTYRVCDMVSVSAGIANTTGPVIGGANVGGGLVPVSFGRAQPYKAESYKTYMFSGALTAPEDWGFLKGSTAYAGYIAGWGGGATVSAVTQNIYLGATLATPVEGLRVGLAYDYVCNEDQNLPTIGRVQASWANAASLYASFQCTEKLSLHGRFEYMWRDNGDNGTGGPLVGAPNEALAITATLQYDLWKNVISRLEFRWDKATDGTTPYGGDLNPVGGGINAGVGGAPNKENSVLVAANLIYKF
jgi:hypothetical protein